MKHFTHILLSSLIAAALLACLAQRSDGAVNNPEPATRDMQFRSGDITLAGTLMVPSNMVAAVVLVHGSGKQLRDVPLAQTLVHMGVATLTYDKRGVGKSDGIYAGPEVGTNNTDPRNLDVLAGDASAAVKELAHEISSPGTPVGLLGFSQAGWIIPLAAVRTPEVKFLILWSGPLVTTVEQLRFQHLTDGNADFWDHHTEKEVREHIRSDPDRFMLVATDPVDSLRKLSIPGLWLYGDRDVYVPVTLSIERLKELAASGKPFEYHLFPGFGHNLSFDQALSASMDWLVKTVAQEQRGKSRDVPGS
jgi:pimeloyl-ACP methyl ester carboxylesterase